MKLGWRDVALNIHPNGDSCSPLLTDADRDLRSETLMDLN